MPKSHIAYDYSLMLKRAVGSKGISEKKLNSLKSKMKGHHQAAHRLLDSGEQGFIENLFHTHEEKEILKLAKRIQKDFKQLLVIGIGGSDLGARALQHIFREKATKMEIFFLGDSTDPLEISDVMKKIDWKHCAINPVSKSGNTVEPSSVFFLVREKLIKAVGKDRHAKHIFVTTEDHDSVMHQVIEQNGYQLVPHPPTIGGRWTVLSVVGLLSAAASGIDIKTLRKGGRDYYQIAKKSSWNAPMVYAALHALGMKQGQSLAVLMPYAGNLEKFAGWYRQLFAESLGKAKNRKKKKIYAGLTPISAAGPKDQHSQLQLYNEGPHDKLITFLRSKKDSLGLVVPKHRKGEELHEFLNGTAFHRILEIEQESTSLSLASNSRPNGVVILKDLRNIRLVSSLSFLS